MQKYDPWVLREEFANAIGDTHKQLLDVGTGRGYTAILFAKKGSDVTSIDINPEKLENARKVAKEYGMADKIRFLKKDITKNSNFPFNSFDMTVMLNALHHIAENERSRSIKEIARITREVIHIGELNDAGVVYFDTLAHPGSKHRELMVEETWITSQLENYGKVDVLHLEHINIYSCKVQE